jgi:hypothetical protein
LLIGSILLLSAAANAQIEITLKKSFIERFKNRVTIKAAFTVDKAHKNVNPPSKDGDMHIAGRSAAIGLATVAELMNAKFESPSVSLIRSVEGTGQTVNLSGVWRLWCEHSGGAHQVQGKPLKPFNTTNPDHVFEVHPITALNGESVVKSLIPIAGFKTKDAEQAFTIYERIDSQIIPGTTTVKLITEMAGFNYVEFILRLNEDEQFVVEDGRMVFASVHDLDGNLLVRNRRMVFVKDSEPEKRVKSLKKGDALHVLGVPRINLALVSWRINNFKKNPGVLNWNLPYEIIVVGVYPDTPEIE